jgi:hypothetical protein
MPSHTAVLVLIDHPYMCILRLPSVTMGTTGSAMAWASLPARLGVVEHSSITNQITPYC